MNLERKPLSETTRQRFRDQPLGFVQNCALTQLVVFPRRTVPSRSFTAASAQSGVQTSPRVTTDIVAEEGYVAP